MSDTASECGDSSQRMLAAATQRARETSRDLAAISSRVASIRERVKHDSEQLSQLEGISAQVTACQERISLATGTSGEVISRTREELGGSCGQLEDALAEVELLVNAVSAFASRVSSVQRAIGKARAASEEIGQIARLTRILAGNASLEAARVGGDATGFEVVAGEFKSLSCQTSRATEELADTLVGLSRKLDALGQHCAQGVAKAREIHQGSEAARHILQSSLEATERLNDFNSGIQQIAEDVQMECSNSNESIQELVGAMAESVDKTTRARVELDRLGQITEDLLSETVDSKGPGGNGRVLAGF